MLRKIIPVIRATVFIWGCILIPLFFGIKYIKSYVTSDSMKYVDAFIHSEGIGMSKHLALQFENTQKEIDRLCFELKAAGMRNMEGINKVLKSTVQTDNNIFSVKIYHENGTFFASADGKSESDLAITKQLQNLGQNAQYSVEQLESGDIVVKYTILRPLGDEIEASNYFMEIVIKWNKYESYIQKMLAGSFPRMFYILSPDCVRYVSMNCMPIGSKHKETQVALGLHLASKINTVPSGLSNVKIDSKTFRVFKDDVNVPANLIGNKFSVMIATDDSAVDALSSGMNRISIVMSILVAVWLVLCLFISRFYNKTKEQLEIAETITDSTPLAVAIFKAEDGKLMQVNLSGTSLLRIAKEDMQTLNMWDIFISPDDKEYMKNASASGINVLNYEVLVQSFGGGSFWSICSASPIKINDETYVVLAVLDINSRKEIEKKLANNAELLEKQISERTADLEEKAKELEQSNALLEKAKSVADEANAAKSKFLTNMSNEFKTPVNAIIGYSEILREEALDRKDNVSADDLQKILGSAKHLLSLIDEILDLSKIEAGKTQFSFENIDISDIIKEVEGVAMPLITENDNSLFLEFPKDIGSMYTDATKLRQCLLNLLSNAAKFTEFGKVTLRAAPIVHEGIDFIEFAVIDTGAGIPADKLGTIFESFQDNTTKNAGTGLGLSITKKYVEYMGGSISVDSDIGVGSKFTIRIPRICTVTSGDNIIVKNQSEEEILEEEVQTAENEISTAESLEAKTFSRKSDNNG
ncbi:MAG: PAS domain-containing sensor histidine kinase [Alphaproteobacteria bacterium]|nr:PAS domain-containing sensor histidine kinase [Alphaproteobacteria bacterium]